MLQRGKSHHEAVSNATRDVLDCLSAGSAGKKSEGSNTSSLMPPVQSWGVTSCWSRALAAGGVFLVGSAATPLDGWESHLPESPDEFNASPKQE